MKQHPGNIGANFHYLFLKQYISQIKSHEQDLKQIVRNNMPLQLALQMQKYPLENQKSIFRDLFNRLSQQKWAQDIIQKMSQKLVEKAKQLYQFQTQRNYFLVQNFRQTCNPPVVRSKPEQCFNLSILFKVNINKQLRRTIWTKCLMIQQNKMEFFKYDHKISPYNLTEELSIGLIRLSQENGIKLKQNQKDCCLRLLEYVVKKWDRIPNKSQQYLALMVVDVYAHYTPSRMYEIGSVFAGLIELTEIYFQQNVQKRLQLLHLAFQLVDPQTYTLIQNSYLPYSQKSNKPLNNSFQHFRLTLSSSFFPFSASQFIIDQLLIKKRNKLDMYIIYALLTMIMSDDLQKYKDAKMQLTDIINPQNTKKVIKLEDVVDAFKVIYENVGAFHERIERKNEKIEEGNVNKLLDKLRQFDQQNERMMTKNNGTESAPVSLKVIDPIDRMAGFVVQQNTEVLRLGDRSK